MSLVSPSFSPRALLTLGTALALCAAPALAAPPTLDIPSSVLPGQVEKRFDAPLEAPATPNLQIPTPKDRELSQEEKDKLAAHSFVLDRVEIEGNSVYTPEALQSLYASKLKQKITLLDAHEIASALTARLRNDGYVLSQALVPPQEVTDGTLKLRVVEGVIGSVALQGDIRGETERNILMGYGEKMKAMRPARVQDLEHYLLLINDIPGVTVSGLLRPAPDQVGAAELVLTLKNKTYEGSYTLDNRGSKYIGPWQHTVSLASNSTFGLFDRTAARFFFTDPTRDELVGGDLRYETIVGSEGTALSAVFSHIRTKPGDALKILDIKGQSTNFGLKAVQPLVRQRRENLLVRAAFDVEDSKTDVFDDTPYSRDKLRVLRAGGTYNVIDPLRGNNLLDTSISKGLNIFGATKSGIDRSNAVGESDFTKIQMEAVRTQPLPAQLSLLVGAKGQYAFDPLLSDEQFSLGGSEYGRAFDSGTVIGDHGLAGKIELRYTDIPSLRYLSSYQFYSFYDIGRVWIKDGAVGANDKASRSSVGVGVRVSFTENFSGVFEADCPLVAPSDEQTRYRHNPRLFMSVTASF